VYIPCSVTNSNPLLKKKWWSCNWGETTSLNCGHQPAYCLSLRWYLSMENHVGMMMSTEENSRLIHQLWQSHQQRHLVASQMNGQKGWEFSLVTVFLFILVNNFLHAVKYYDMGPQALLLHWTKAYRRFLLPLKSHCLGWVLTCILGSNGKYTNH
jgi:hypothetical protein